MYNLTEYVQQQGHKTPSDQQIKQMKKTQQYLKKHKIHELFNVSISFKCMQQMFSRLIETKPQNPKQGMAEILKQIKKKSSYFKRSDFEQIFDTYNFFEQKAQNKIPYNYLIQALRRININYEKQQFLSKYPKFNMDQMITKNEFVNIMDQQYKNLTKFDY